MPTYDYRCTSCNYQFEEFCKVDSRDEPTERDCSECGKKSITRDVNGTMVVSGVNLAAKVPSGFKDVLSKIKKAHPHHKIGGELS